MVKEITAYEASDGTVFASALDAAKHDAVLQLKQLEIFNYASALAVVENSGKIIAALAPLAKYQSRVAGGQ